MTSDILYDFKKKELSRVEKESGSGVMESVRLELLRRHAMKWLREHDLGEGPLFYLRSVVDELGQAAVKGCLDEDSLHTALEYASEIEEEIDDVRRKLQAGADPSDFGL